MSQCGISRQFNLTAFLFNSSMSLPEATPRNRSDPGWGVRGGSEGLKRLGLEDRHVVDVRDPGICAKLRS